MFDASNKAENKKILKNLNVGLATNWNKFKLKN